LQTKIVKQFFKGFILKFRLFFGELEQGFINEIVVNLFARTFNAGENIIDAGQVVTQLMFIVRG
jgi:hypothetical protein